MRSKMMAEVDMCSRPLLGKIIKFSLPLIFSSILQLLYNAADIIVVGRFAGSDAMAAVGSTGALVNLITNLFIGLSVGALAGTARYIGAHDADNVDKIVHSSVLLSLVGGVMLAILGFFMSDILLVAMQTPPEVLKLSSLYLKIFFLGMPFNLLYNFGSSILRACGDTKRPMIFLTIAGIINVLLNLFFVITLKMSVAGVALATIISQAVSAILVILCLMKRQGFGKFVWRKLRFHKIALLKIIAIGLPAGIQSTIFSLSNVIIQSSINSLGNVVMAGNAASANIEGFIYVAMNGIAQACLTFSSQNFGAGNRNNINIIFRQTSIITVVGGLAMGGLVLLFGNQLLSLYNTDPAVIAVGLERLKLISMTYFLCGMMEVLVSSLRGIGHSALPMVVSILGICGIRIIWIFLIFAKNSNLTSLYLSYPISWAVTCVLQYIALIIARRRNFGKKA